VKLVLLARTDLAMSRGKIAAQVAHAAVLAALNGLGTADFATWLEQGQPKVVLKVGAQTSFAGWPRRGSRRDFRSRW
jgi:PTH2 family peptidyl-tRNA hydrolase